MEPILEERRPLIEWKEHVSIMVIVNFIIAIWVLFSGVYAAGFVVVLFVVVSFILLKVFKSRVSLFDDRIESRGLFLEDTSRCYLSCIQRIEIEDYAPLGIDFFKQRVLTIYKTSKWVVFRVRVTDPEQWKKTIEAHLLTIPRKPL